MGPSDAPTRAVGRPYLGPSEGGRTGSLKTTVKATVDGYYRFSCAGTTTTPAVNAPGDLVRVKK
ncbi:hypothetical protein ACIQCF_19385 [Streptomyces sp. NPDC088353]|uniref:hypothetical protein n=1 Tax=unclassified Streptomyces TaxID=2593676 RepID=UPI0036B1390A